MKRIMAIRVAILGGAAAVGLLALGGCGKKSETAAGSAATGTAAPATATASAPSAPMTPPPRKAGLWEVKIATSGMNQTMKQCLDEGLARKMKWWGSQAQKAG